VVSVERLTPRMVSIRLGGDALEGFPAPAPTSHIKIFLPPEGQTELKLPEFGPDGPVWPADAPRPDVRTYTPRRFDPATRTLEVQFVLHGHGRASAWAEQAAAGDRVAVAGPGGRFELDPAVERWFIAGDESAIPAVAMLLEALPATATADVHLEVDGRDDEMPLPTAADAAITWHHRRTPGAWGAELHEAARNAKLADGTHVWVACEAAAMRGIRRHLLAERGLPAPTLTTRGYWRLGTANHPDHDYGEDD
jgi:NADPH-dependent ferric siderophore reductase